MPFTPIHLGPGLAFKALGGRHFSFMVFGGAQVLMDLEPLIGILQNRDVLHGVTHTWLGALVIGSVAAVIGKPISTMVLRWRKIAHPPLTWLAAMAGAYAGTFSYVLVDAIMHARMAPAWRVLRGNPMLDLISIDQLHLACLAAGVLGLPMALMRARAQARSSG